MPDEPRSDQGKATELAIITPCLTCVQRGRPCIGIYSSASSRVLDTSPYVYCKPCHYDAPSRRAILMCEGKPAPQYSLEHCQ